MDILDKSVATALENYLYIQCVNADHLFQSCASLGKWLSMLQPESPGAAVRWVAA